MILTIENPHSLAAEAREHEDHSNDSDIEIQEGIETSSHSQDEERDQDRDLENTLSRVSTGPPYTVFSHKMKWWIVGMNSISAFISPITGNIYFPALPTLASDLGVGLSQINLTLTTYMIFQALAPTIFGDFGDIAGRRPAFSKSAPGHECFPLPANAKVFATPSNCPLPRILSKIPKPSGNSLRQSLTPSAHSYRFHYLSWRQYRLSSAEELSCLARLAYGAEWRKQWDHRVSVCSGG